MASTGIMALLAGKPKGKGGSEKSGPPAFGDEEASGGEVGEALLEMHSALKAGDGEGAELAFKRAYESCAGEPDDDEEISELDSDIDDELAE